MGVVGLPMLWAYHYHELVIVMGLSWALVAGANVLTPSDAAEIGAQKKHHLGERMIIILVLRYVGFRSLVVIVGVEWCRTPVICAVNTHCPPKYLPSECDAIDGERKCTQKTCAQCQQ